MGAHPVRRWLAASTSTAFLALLVTATSTPSRADTYPIPQSTAVAGQPFAADVVGSFHGLARRADPLAAKRDIGPQATDCQHQEGMTRHDAPDGTPYMFISRSGKDPGVACIVGDEPGTLYVVRMGSRNRDGERMSTNLLPWDGSALRNRPHVASGEDVVVQAIPLDGHHGLPFYLHPGGMQAVGDLLVIGTEDPYNIPDATNATVLFLNVHDPANPTYIGKLDIRNAGDDAGADPVGLTVVKDGNGQQRYLLIAAGGPANKEVRFYRSPPLTDAGALDPANWELSKRYSYVTITNCLGGSYLIDGSAVWPIGTGLFDTGQHQMLNFVREGDLDGQLYLFGGRRDGAIVNPFANEYLDLYKVNLTSDGVPDACPLSADANGISRQMGETSWDQPLDTGSFSAASGMYVSPAGEVMVYEAPHENGSVILFGQFRALDEVRHSSSTLRPTATVDGPVVVDEGSAVQMTGHGTQAATKAFVELFQNDGAGVSFSDPVWFHISYDDWAELGSENLQNSIRYLIDSNGVPYVDHLIWEKASSLRWFAPQGCNIAATDYPIISNSWPGPDTIILKGDGGFHSVPNLDSTPTYLAPGDSYPSTPVPSGVTATNVGYDNDIEGISFTTPVLVDGTAYKQLGCDSYYNATVGLGWDVDNNGTYETSGGTALFSASQLDGPTTSTVTARAQHPTDTTDLGTGDPFSFPVTVRNVAPRVQPAAVTDSLGHDLTASGAVAIIGLPVSLAVDFTDPGVADTQTGAVNWGDGTSSTTFDSFTDAHGGATGHLRATHTFTASGARTITTTITDDDGGATPVTRTIQVLSLKDALAAAAQQITTLIGTTTNSSIAAALRAARDELIGNHGGTPPTNGATDKLDAKDPVGAITKIQAAIADLAYAESLGAGDLTGLKDLLGLIAQGIATDTYAKTRAAIPKPSSGQTKTFAVIEALIAQGHQQLVTRQYSGACDSFKQATSKSLGMLK